MDDSDQMILYVGLLAGALQLIGYLLYLRDEEIEPNPVTWLMFAYGTILLTLLEWDRQASGAELALPAVCSCYGDLCGGPVLVARTSEGPFALLAAGMVA